MVTSAKSAAGSAKNFSRTLSYGLSGDDVKLLQQILIKENVYPEKLITGYFGKATLAAVIKFQEKYFDDILRPAGLTKGSGLVGPGTRAKLNKLIP
jgi:peptidoglycan hydrolase-like protein with peptidoglycan-binding domain